MMIDDDDDDMMMVMIHHCRQRWRKGGEDSYPPWLPGGKCYNYGGAHNTAILGENVGNEWW